MPYSVLNAACCCTRDDCSTPYIVFRPCNAALDVPDVVATPFIQEECGFVAGEQVYLFDSPYCDHKYCGTWLCDPDINEDTDYCIPGVACGCDAASLPRLIRPSDNICDKFEALSNNDGFEDGSCCDTRCPERESSCYDGDVIGDCPEGSRLRACDCTTVDDLQYSITVNWQQRDTTTPFYFDYYDQDGNIVVKHCEDFDCYVRMAGVNVVEHNEIPCDPDFPGTKRNFKYLVLETTWEAVFNLRAPTTPNGISYDDCVCPFYSPGWRCPDGACGSDGLAPTLSWTDTIVTKDLFSLGVFGDKAYLVAGGFAGPPYPSTDTSATNTVPRGNGCPDTSGAGGNKNQAYKAFTFIQGIGIFNGLNSGLFFSGEQSDVNFGVEICAGMTGTHTSTSDVYRNVTPGPLWACIGGGPAFCGESNYGTWTITLNLTAPPAPNQQGAC